LYKDLAWQKAMDLAEDIYRLTIGFPREELYGLTSQMAMRHVRSKYLEGLGVQLQGSSNNFSG
jgi:four helix bundle protein